MRKFENTTLGKYEVIKAIGRGSMGTVYLGYDPFLDREVAIKVAHSGSVNGGLNEGRYRKLFFHEAKVSGMLKHPNIISVHDAGVEDDAWYIVMEYVPGSRTLHSVCTPGNLLPMEDVVRLIFKCAKALDSAHRKGVVHRDVKPKNILLTDEREVKISDFGVALLTRLDVTDTQLSGAVGSPLYMSPESINDETITAQADVFSLGVVLYEMLTGTHPFAAEGLSEILTRITDEPHTPVTAIRPEIPRILEHIVDRALMKKPERRYKSAMDLAADLSLVFDHINVDDEELSAREKFKLVKNLEFFSEFPDSEIWEVISSSQWQEFIPAAEIVHEGEIDNSFYVIVIGDVSVRKGSKDVEVLHQGDCFGEMGFVAKRQRTATIVAQDAVTVLRVRASLIDRASLTCQLRFKDAFLNTLVKRLSEATSIISGDMRIAS
jgi:serine/threonine protein kinase